MAAPSGTQWGNTVSSKARIGIYISTSSSNTQTKVTIQVWFWSKYAVHDENNDYYFNNNATSATTRIGSKDIYTTVSSGAGWSTKNQQKLAESTYTYDRGTSAVKRNCAAKLTNIDVAPGTMTATASYTIPALASYKITYNANGGSGAPTAQTYYYGKNIKLSTTRPTRTGYEFKGWSTSSSATAASYSPGSTFPGSTAKNVTLYAVWERITYSVTFDADGGEVEGGVLYSKTVNHGDKVGTLPVPTRKNYKFLGWYTSSGTQVTANTVITGTVTYYARWQIDAVVYVKSGNSWTQSILYVRTASGIVKANAYVKSNGKWKRAVGE